MWKTDGCRNVEKCFQQLSITRRAVPNQSHLRRRVTNSGNTFIEGFVSLPYGVVTISEAGYRQRRRRMSKKIPRSDLSTLSTPIIILIFRF